MTSEPKQTRDLERELDELREQLIEQEHRGFRILTNFFVEKRKWPKGDPRHDAAWKALLYRFLLSPGMIAVAGGTVGALSVGLLAWHGMILRDQYKEMAHQNEEFRNQTAAITEQNRQQAERFQLQRRTELIAILYEGIDGEDTIEGPTYNHRIPKANARTRSEALAEFHQLERTRLNEFIGPIERPTLFSPPQPRPDLTGALLSDVKARGAMFAGTDFSSANLSGVDFSVANLADANFSAANLAGAGLSWADLTGADLGDANLSAADLGSASLSHATLDSANLSDARLLDSNLSDAILNWANLSGADLAIANLGGVQLMHANLTRADLKDANLAFATLSEADLSFAQLRNANLTGTYLDAADLTGANLTGANLTGANLAGTNLNAADLAHADLTDADLYRADLRGASNLSCEQLALALNLDTAFRDEEHACGSPMSTRPVEER